MPSSGLCCKLLHPAPLGHPLLTPPEGECRASWPLAKPSWFSLVASFQLNITRAYRVAALSHSWDGVRTSSKLSVL